MVLGPVSENAVIRPLRMVPSIMLSFEAHFGSVDMKRPGRSLVSGVTHGDLPARVGRYVEISSRMVFLRGRLSGSGQEPSSSPT